MALPTTSIGSASPVVGVESWKPLPSKGAPPSLAQPSVAPTLALASPKPTPSLALPNLSQKLPSVSQTGSLPVGNQRLTGQKDQIMTNVMNAIGEMESGGRYGIVGPVTASGGRAYGKYQVMDFNVPTWTKEATGKAYTKEQYLADPKLQDAVARFKMTQYMNKFGNIADVASVWFSGKPVAGNTRRDTATGLPVPSYVNRILSLYNKYSGRPATQQQGIAATFRPVPQGAVGGRRNPEQFRNLSQQLFKTLGVTTVEPGGSTKFEKTHPGIDIANKMGTPIRAFAPGKVVAVERGKKKGDKGYGNYIIVEDPYGNKHRYSHLQDAWVKVGDQIKPGQQVAALGNSGQTYSASGGDGSHLDYRVADAAGKHLNPTSYLNQLYQKLYAS